MPPEVPQVPLILQIAAALLMMGFVACFMIGFCVVGSLILKFHFSEDYRGASTESARSNKVMNDFLLSPKMSRQRRSLVWSFSAAVLCLLLLLLLTISFGPISIG